MNNHLKALGLLIAAASAIAVISAVWIWLSGVIARFTGLPEILVGMLVPLLVPAYLVCLFFVGTRNDRS